MRRWDQSGAAVDAAGGVVAVPAAAGTPIVLEDGVEVSFDTDPTPGSFHVRDYWVFAARTADASVEMLTEEPPRGILHHFCRLAIVTFPSTVVDCRTFWPPDFGDGEGGHDCACAACVTPESHASGQLTIQMAVDQVKGTGGKVCLQPGFYFLDQAVRIDGAQSLALEGKGWRTILVSAGREPAIVVQRSLGVAIDSLTVLTSTFSSAGRPADRRRDRPTQHDRDGDRALRAGPDRRVRPRSARPRARRSSPISRVSAPGPRAQARR